MMYLCEIKPSWSWSWSWSWFTINGRQRCVTCFTGECFTNDPRALQNILSNFVYYQNRTFYENFKLKLCTCAWAHGQSEILSINVISGMVYFREVILVSSRNISETTPNKHVKASGYLRVITNTETLHRSPETIKLIDTATIWKHAYQRSRPHKASRLN